MRVIERDRKARQFLRKRISNFKRGLGGNDIGKIADDPGEDSRQKVHAEQDRCTCTEVLKIHIPGFSHVIDGRAEESRSDDLKRAAEYGRQDQKDQGDLRRARKAQERR